MPKIKITETVLRDAQQSLISSTMTMDEILPVLPDLDSVGYYSCEVWGRETFETCIRVLNEDPWQRLHKIKEQMPKTKLQMVFHGQSLLGDRQFADDLVEYFIQRSVAGGIEIMRIYDAMNDIRNLEYSVSVARKEGAHVQPVIVFTKSPVHTNATFIQYAKKLEAIGADSICVEDPAGLLSPYDAYELIASLKNEVAVPIQIHAHSISGMAPLAYLKAAEAGVDMMDTAISPLSGGASLPATESIMAAFEGTPYDVGLNKYAVYKVEEYFYNLRDKFWADGRLAPSRTTVSKYAIKYKVTPGLIKYVSNSLKEKGQLGKIEDVLSEVVAIREDAGYPAVIRPISNILAEQAIINVTEGERYKSAALSFKSLIKGEFGLTPAAIDPAFQSEILAEEKPINVRPADLLSPEIDKISRELPQKYNEQQEDVLTLAQFPKAAPSYFKSRSDKLYSVDGRHSDELTQVHPV